jgi:hypothetical protein
MLTMRRARARPGVSVAELAVALTIGGIILALVSAIAFRQQRLFSGTFARTALAAELRETAALLPIDLRGLSVEQGDIRAGEARDTSLEIRATIGSGIVCDTVSGRLVLTPSTSSAPTLTGIVATPQANDSIWLLAPVDTTEMWIPRRIIALTTTSPGQCAAGAPILSGDALTTSRLAIALDTLDTSARPGAVIRFTRPTRYSIYRASDGAWYLGQRDWNPSTGRFNTTQPVTGAFLSPASGGLRFRYFDSSGVELPSGTANTRVVARIDIGLTAETRRLVEIEGSPSTTRRRRSDSASLVIHPRNWR